MMHIGIGGATSGPPSKPHANVTPARPAPAPVETQRAQLASGQKLAAGQSLRSANGRYELSLLQDGNLVERDLMTGALAWSSNTSGTGAQVAIMQGDGNLVLCKADPATACVADNNVVWSSATNGHAGAWLAVQNNGDLTMLPRDASASATPLWQQDIAPEVPSAPPAIATSTPAPDGATGLASSASQTTAAIGLFTPGEAPLGIQQFTLSPGDNAYEVFKQHGIFAHPVGPSDAPVLASNLAATPSLDPVPFGTQPAEPWSATRRQPVGQTITVLDATRLGYLQKERAQLGAAEKGDSKARADARASLTLTIYQELDYAATRQAVPDVQALAATIRARAPRDPTFQAAIDTAASMYESTLAAQGRSASQLGKIDSAAAAGNWTQVRQFTSQQLVAAAGNDQGAAALGDVVARSSVYLTYAGGSPRFVQAVQQGTADAEHTLLVDRPVERVLASYRSGGAADAMRMLDTVTDPQETTPAQVGQIMSDARILNVAKRSLSDIGVWTGTGNGANASRVLPALMTACQRAIVSDTGAGPGKQAVDAIATYFVQQADSSPNDNSTLVLQQTPFIRGLAYNAAYKGNIALQLAIAAEAQRCHNPTYASMMIDATVQGLKGFQSGVASDEDDAEANASFITIPLYKEWGYNSTPAEQQQLINKLLADDPSGAAKLQADNTNIENLQEPIDGIDVAMSAYQSELHGVVGFDVAVPESKNDGNYLWSAPAGSSVAKLVEKLAPPGVTGKATNALWFLRAYRKVTQQVGEYLIGKLSRSGFLSDEKAESILEAWKQYHATIGCLLYEANAVASLSEASEGGVVSLAQNGLSAIREALAGGTNALTLLSDALPEGKAPWLKPGSGKTPLAKAAAQFSGWVDELDVSAGWAEALKGLGSFLLSDTSDIASAALGLSSTIEYAQRGQVWQAVGQGLNTLGYGILLTGPGLDAVTLTKGATVLGLSESALNLIGALVVALGATIYTTVTAYENSHELDGASTNLLEAMGVRADVAEQLAKHSTALGSSPPSAGPFITAYFKYAHASQQTMVKWLNSLTPQSANEMANALKDAGNAWQRMPMSQAASDFDNALLQAGIMPPVQLT